MMFDVSINSKVDFDLPLITANYKDILADEYSMLYCGSNRYGNNIIGSLMCENEDGDVIRYLHLIVKSQDYMRFIKNKISYRELIELQDDVFLIDRDDDDNIVSKYSIKVADIPANYLPLPTFYCPNVELTFGTDYVFSLKGSMADMHEALAERVVIISKGVNQFLNDIIDTVKNVRNIAPEIRLIPYTPTSFGINYRIQVNSKVDLFEGERESAVNEFVAKSIDYSINYLSKEVEALQEHKTENTQFEKMVEEPLKKVYNMGGGKYDDAAKEKALKNIMKTPYDLEKITDQLGFGFDYISINSIDKNLEVSPIGLVDATFSDEIEDIRNEIEKGETVETDDYLNEYDIHVYHLNKLSRKGNAHIKNSNEQGKEILDSPKILIKGDKSLDGSEFISSMDKGEFIRIKAKAKKVNGRFKTLTIEF